MRSPSPMLAEKGEPFDNPAWGYQMKIDGGRVLAYLNGGTTLYTREGRDCTLQFPELANLHDLVQGRGWLDGEVGSLSGFSLFARRIHLQKALDIRIASKANPMIYFAFDWLGEDLEFAALPLSERQANLKVCVKNEPPVRVLPLFKGGDGAGIKLFEKAKEAGLEGIMAKRLTSPYYVGKRSPDWLKVKCFRTGVFQIYGCTIGLNARQDTFGALILGEQGRFVGCCGTGWNDKQLAELLKTLQTVKAEFCDLQNMVLDKPVLFYCKPVLSCKVQYLEFGTEGHLRFPSFKGLFVSAVEEANGL